MNNVQRGGSIEGIIGDPDVKDLLKETLEDTARIASMPGGSMSKPSDEGSEIPMLISADDDDDPESQM